MRKEVLVTGGLGFIGSHTVVALHEAGYMPILLDNLSNSDIGVLDRLTKLMKELPAFFEGDVNDAQVFERIFSKHQPIAVVHFAAFKAVGESVEQPLKYYKNNVGGLLTLLEVMGRFGCRKMVFSSSCTVYGEPDTVPVSEYAPFKMATSPYGATKQMGEVILKDLKDSQVQSLRYFNPVGAHESGLIGELPIGVPNNLVPYLTQTAAGWRDKLIVHGGDYPTPDGTCIRDYIHVMDLAEAHVMSLKALEESEEAKFEAFNIGTGTGASVLEVIKTFEQVNGVKVPYVIGPRRPGDVVKVWANSEKVQKVLGWGPKRGLEKMMKDAWNWQKGLRPSP